MSWIPKGTPYDVRPPGELATFELAAFLAYAEERLGREDLEPRQRAGLTEWRRQLLAEQAGRAAMAAEAKERIAAMRATGRQSP